MYILNVRKKVLGVIISFEVATHQPPILFLLVDGVLVDCCLSFAHRWICMAPSYKEMLLEQEKRALGLLLSRLKDGVLPWGSLTIVADEIGVTRHEKIHALVTIQREYLIYFKKNSKI